jgi:hypothetical protein
LGSSWFLAAQLYSLCRDFNDVSTVVVNGVPCGGRELESLPAPSKPLRHPDVV